MGFGVTSAHLIVFVALVTAGNVAATALWDALADVRESGRVEAARHEAIAHTNATVVGTPTWSSPNYSFNVKNTGSTVLNATKVDYVVDGAWTNNVASRTVDGSATTTLWMPGETMGVTLAGISTNPTKLWIATENGVTTYYR